MAQQYSGTRKPEAGSRKLRYWRAKTVVDAIRGAARAGDAGGWSGGCRDASCRVRLRVIRDWRVLPACAHEKQRQDAQRQHQPGDPDGTIVATACLPRAHASLQCKQDAMPISAACPTSYRMR